jgi:hypothetical protein
MKHQKKPQIAAKPVSMASYEVVYFSVGAASCRDDRGWKPLPRGRRFIADRAAQDAVTGFFRVHQFWSLSF